MAEGAIVPTREQSSISLQCPKLTSTNYTTWAILVESILQANGLHEAIDPITGVTVDQKKKFTARAFILQSLPEDILLQVAKHTEARDVWESIRVRFLGADRVQKARLQTLRTELEKLHRGESETIDEFSGKILAVVAKFKELGSSIEDEVVVRKLLSAVPTKFMPIVAAIEQFADLDDMLFEEAVGRLKAYEERVKVNNVHDQEKLLLAKTNVQEKKEEFCCVSCGRGCSSQSNGGRGRGRDRGRGRFRPNEDRGERRANRDKSYIRCYNCQEYGHYAYECPKSKPKEEEANFIQDDKFGPALL